MDKIYFGVNESSFTSSNTLEYEQLTILKEDRIDPTIWILWRFWTNSSAVGGTKRTGVAGGTSFTADRTFIEEDSNVSMSVHLHLIRSAILKQ